MPKFLSAVSMNRRQFTTSAAASAALLATSKSVFAQDGTPAAEGASPMETLASGLSAPRFLAIDGDTIYFTEAGAGGDTPVFEIPGEGTPEPTSPVSGTGLTGKLSKLDADGTVTVIVDDFRSYT
ncbi:MAG TPA: hypothetical protein VNZ58_03150, partial [Thermomicrobiales bacterium]|nr:hypothetical protein [Thermomicrobiales bacterium]